MQASEEVVVEKIEIIGESVVYICSVDEELCPISQIEENAAEVKEMCIRDREIIRRNSLNELRAMGIDPYPAAEYVTNAFSTDIKAEFKDDEEPRQRCV